MRFGGLTQRQEYTYSAPPPYYSRIYIIRLVLMVVSLLAILALVYHQYIVIQPALEPSNFYGLLGDAFLSGQTYLKITPSPQLLALADPYDPHANAPYLLWDASLYNGKYYLYFGPGPALIWAAAKAIFGVSLSDPQLVLGFPSWERHACHGCCFPLPCATGWQAMWDWRSPSFRSALARGCLSCCADLRSMRPPSRERTVFQRLVFSHYGKVFTTEIIRRLLACAGKPMFRFCRELPHYPCSQWRGAGACLDNHTLPAKAAAACFPNLPVWPLVVMPFRLSAL